MNDGNDKHEGAWWGNLETLKPSQVQSDYSYVDEDDRRKKFIIIAAVIGIVLVLLLGGVTAFTVIKVTTQIQRKNKRKLRKKRPRLRMQRRKNPLKRVLSPSW